MGPPVYSTKILRLRTPLIACSTYFRTHPLGIVSQTQAERASVISLAAFDFKQDLELGKLEGTSHHCLVK